MSATDQLQVTPVPASIDNPGDWEALASEIAVMTGTPTTVTADLLVGMVGTAVPLLFAADAARNVSLLRGTFADLVVAQCTRNAGDLHGVQPVSVVAHLVGAHDVDGHPVLRTHLSIQTRDPDGATGVQSQFWDLQLGGDVTVAQPSCPNCGAPLGKGELLCGHCHTDVRNVVHVPLVVSRLELY